MATALTAARKGDTEARPFTLKADGVAISLGSAVVKMRYRTGGTRTWSTISTADTPNPMLVVTNAASGIVTFTPTATFWVVGVYEIYFSVDGTTDYNLPRSEMYTVTVAEGA